MIRWRSHLLLSTFLLAALILAVRAAILTVGDESTARANLATISRSPATYDRLSRHMSTLELMTGNIEQYNLGQIKDAVTRTVALVKQASAEFVAQRESWEKIQTLIRKDRISFREHRQQLDDVQRLQAGEVRD